MNRRAFFLAGPLGALAAFLGLRPEPKFITATWSDDEGWIPDARLNPELERLWLETERAAAKLALVRK